MSLPASARAAQARELVESLQARFAEGLGRVSARHGGAATLDRAEWRRDEGRHGGGDRYYAGYGPVFNRGAINVSVVHYDDMPDKRLGSATALSTIIHPRHPLAPSVHMHISWTEMRDGTGYWRVMADLNPATPSAEGQEAGDRYFHIPALDRHRGVSHFYLEGHATEDPAADFALARGVGEGVIDLYCELLGEVLEAGLPVQAADEEAQRAYHTAYLLQVLTLDRGTTSGLLVHGQNDLGIMGSLPSFVDRELLASWRERLPEIQRPLLDALVGALSDASPSPVTNDVRAALAEAVRDFYRQQPEALELQASGGRIPPTVANHGPR
jgi:coproporphyrinogen III oxidase